MNRAQQSIDPTVDLTIDLNQADVYTEHLAEVNQHHKVVASEDIFNQRGFLLIKKGASLDSHTQRRIAQFKLQKSIDQSVNIDKSLNSENLLKEIHSFLNQFPQFRAIHESLELEADLKILCAAYNQFTVIKQKLTVLSLQLPTYFKHSLGVAWLSMLIAHRMKLKEEKIQSAFLAGLCMEIGFLHLDPVTVKKEGKRTEKQIKLLQGHTVIGWQIIQSIENMNADVAQAVLEHHERCDGSGYSESKFRDELGLIGQILGMAGFILDNQTPTPNEQTKQIADLIPALQVNALVHKYEVYDAVITLCRQWSHACLSKLTEDTIDPFIDEFLRKNKQLKRWIHLIDTMIAPFAEEQEDRRLLAIKQTYVHILGSTYNSGFLDENYIRWLIHVKTEKIEGVYREVEEVGLLMDEIEKHLDRVTKLFKDLMDLPTAKYSAYEKVIHQGLGKIHYLLHQN